jgi:hypothetical protein
LRTPQESNESNESDIFENVQKNVTEVGERVTNNE